MRQSGLISRTFVQLASAALGAIAFSACADDKIIYRDRPPFKEPVAAAAGFLGYYDAAQKQTTCGNCHADIQGSWKGTQHAGAWATLNASTAKAATCYGCHTVTGNGNKTVGTTVGHDAVKENTYYDVQCESCHGPGLQHVEGVGQATLIRPLAKLSMTGTGNCGDCHSGAHQPFAEEWKQSGHANVSASRASNASCAGCHDGRGVLKRWGVDDNYAERDSATSYQATTCAVCHAPHGSENPKQLRFSVTSADPEQNLCMQCHMRRTEPTTSSYSPHAPQGAVLLGFAGYRPAGFAYDTARIYGSHATTQNPKLCAGCHVSKFTVTDKLTGAFSFQATGHLMRPVPCLDSLGKPTGIKTCDYTSTARSWQSCSASGCHASATVAAAAFNTVRTRMKNYADQLWIDSNGNGTINASPTDGGLLAKVKQSAPSAWNATDAIVSPAEGAEFNTRMCGEYNSPNSDNSKGIHNPFLCESLFIATINEVKSTYGVTLPAPSPIVGNEPIGGEFSRSMHVSRKPRGR